MSKPYLFQGDIPDEIFNELIQCDEVGVDCEMMGLNPRRDRLCLVQIAAEKGPQIILQVIEADGAHNMKRLFEDKNCRKIFHYARMDTLFLHFRLNINVTNVYCTKIASKLARTYSERHGLRELVREFTGDNLDKMQQSSDWGREKLLPEQINYAISDVLYLFKIRRYLNLILEREHRMDLFQKLIQFLPTQRELDILGYDSVFEH